MNNFCIQCGRSLTDVAVVMAQPICGPCVRLNQRRAPLSPPDPCYCTVCGAAAELVDGVQCFACRYQEVRRG